MPTTRTARFPGTPEEELLLNCARVHLPPAHAARVRALAHDGPDWEALLRLAERHKLLPLLHRHLAAAERDEVPESVRRTLRARSVANGAGMLWLAGELARLLRRLEAEGIAAAPYKGPALAAQLYGDIALRQAGDLDVLVGAADVPRTRALLPSLGFSPRHRLTSDARAYMLATRYAEEFVRDDGCRLELHWRFTNRDARFPLGYESLAPRLGRVDLGGTSVPAFHLEDLLLVLCVHGAKHRWDSLELICGVAETVRLLHDADWPAIVERAARLGSRRVLLLGLTLAHDLLDAPLPPAVVGQARADRHVPHLVPVVLCLLSGDEMKLGTRGSIEGDWFRLRLRDDTWHRVRFVASRLTTPSDPAEWRVVRIGGRVLPVHMVTRPLRLLGRILRGAHRAGGG